MEYEDEGKLASRHLEHLKEHPLAKHSVFHEEHQAHLKEHALRPKKLFEHEHGL